MVIKLFIFYLFLHSSIPPTRQRLLLGLKLAKCEGRRWAVIGSGVKVDRSKAWPVPPAYVRICVHILKSRTERGRSEKRESGVIFESSCRPSTVTRVQVGCQVARAYARVMIGVSIYCLLIVWMSTIDGSIIQYVRQTSFIASNLSHQSNRVLLLVELVSLAENESAADLFAFRSSIFTSPSGYPAQTLTRPLRVAWPCPRAWVCRGCFQ